MLGPGQLYWSSAITDSLDPPESDTVLPGAAMTVARRGERPGRPGRAVRRRAGLLRGHRRRDGRSRRRCVPAGGSGRAPAADHDRQARAEPGAVDLPGRGLGLGVRQGRAGTLLPGAAVAAGASAARAGVLPRSGRAQARRRRLPQHRPGQPARQAHPPDPGRRACRVHRHRDAPRPGPALAHRPPRPALQLRTEIRRLRQHDRGSPRPGDEPISVRSCLGTHSRCRRGGLRAMSKVRVCGSDCEAAVQEPPSEAAGMRGPLGRRPLRIARKVMRLRHRRSE